MKKSMSISITLLCSLVFFVAFAVVNARAGEVSKKNDGSISYQTGIDDCYVELNADGLFKRVYSRKSHTVRIPDRTGIIKAQTIAEEKAKAAIVRYMDENVKTAKITADVQGDMEKTKMVGSSITKTDQRLVLDGIAEFTASTAAASLKGVKVLERGYDAKEGVAWVEVGISQKSIDGSNALKRALSGEGSAKDSSGKSSQSKSEIYSPGSEVQKTKQKDW